jgi:hypothetical protein
VFWLVNFVHIFPRNQGLKVILHSPKISIDR